MERLISRFFCITTCTLAEVQTLNAIFDGFVQHKSADTAEKYGVVPVAFCQNYVAAKRHKIA